MVSVDVAEYGWKKRGLFPASSRPPAKQRNILAFRCSNIRAALLFRRKRDSGLF